ncbi:MAG: hypothetical protein ACK5AS_08900 [Bacteroidota bacterium]|nr:hypothetical protein [Bacteroidota bacterium]
MKKHLTLFIIIILAGLFTACKKNSSCYDEVLYQKHKNDICTMDCPGVVGCDGKTYCNECIARTKGIRLK